MLSTHAANLVSPKLPKSLRIQFLIAQRVRNVPAPQVLLDRPRVLALAGKPVGARMPQHLRMTDQA